jgi:hypothetical protein
VKDGEVVALHHKLLYSSRKQRKGGKGSEKVGNKYPVGKIIRFCTEQANRPQFVDKFDFILFSSNLKLLFPIWEDNTN